MVKGANMEINIEYGEFFPEQLAHEIEEEEQDYSLFSQMDRDLEMREIDHVVAGIRE